ncbi:MAG: hypothetical protein OES13_02720 [Acidimicrobiia bacterium]|nr:hypothetical protein [Acidimicrobiia bacterium]
MTTPPIEPEAHAEASPLDPGTHLRLSVLLSVIVNLAYGLPIALWPDLIWGTLAGGTSSDVELLSSMRWGGAVLVAWAIGGVLVLSRPKGRQTMVTTFALQFSLATAALIVSALADEFAWAETWFVLAAIIVVGASALYLWYGRWAGRQVLNA